MAARKSKLLELRKAELELADIVNNFSGVTSSAGRLSTAHIQFTDSLTATASWLAAYRNAKARKLPEPKAVEFAEDVTSMTQGSSLKSQLAPIQRTAVGKALTLFQTFTISDWNLMYSEIFGVGTKGIPTKTVIGRVYRTIVATTLFNTLFEDVIGINSPFPTPIRTVVEGMEEGKEPFNIALDMMLELMEPLPLIGGAAKFGNTPLGPIASSARDLFVSLSDPFNEDKLDDTGPLWEAGGRFLPVPGLGQFAKSKRAFERGESPYGIVQGSYTKGGGGMEGLSGLGGLQGF